MNVKDTKKVRFDETVIDKPIKSNELQLDQLVTHVWNQCYKDKDQKISKLKCLHVINDFLLQNKKQDDINAYEALINDDDIKYEDKISRDDLYDLLKAQFKKQKQQDISSDILQIQSIILIGFGFACFDVL